MKGKSGNQDLLARWETELRFGLKNIYIFLRRRDDPQVSRLSAWGWGWVVTCV